MHPWRPKVLFVANPISGGGRAARVAAELMHSVAGVVASARRIDSQPSPAHEWLTPEIGAVDLLVVVGGDGAIRQAAPVLAGTSTLLWHVPAGTENLFAKSIGSDAQASTLAAAVSARRMAVIDLGYAAPVGGTDAGSECAFVLMASCGFDAEVVHRLAAARTGAITHLSYAAPIIATIGSYAAPHVRIELSPQAGSSAECDVHSAGRGVNETGSEVSVRGGVVIANGRRYAANMNPVPGARMDDGQLHAVILPGRGGLAALCWGLRCRAGRAPASLSAPALRVHAKPPARWQLDGDPAPWGAVECVSFRLRERCVRILLPASNAPGAARETMNTSLVHPAEDWTVQSSD